MTRTVQIVLPYHLRNIAKVEDAAIALDIEGAVTVASMLDALEARFPALRGSIRDHATQRAPSSFIRFFACQEDLIARSHRINRCQ